VLGEPVLESTSKIKELGERLLKGIAASSGIAMGKVCVHTDVFAHIREESIEEGQISTEIARMKEAASIVGGRLKSDRSRVLQEANKKDADIFSAHISILRDFHFLNEITSRIAEERINAQTAVIREIDRYATLFSSIEDPYLRERIVDIQDIGHRLLEVLAGPEDFDCPFDEPVVVAALQLTPSDTVRLKPGKVLAFVTERGGRESHAAILARSMGISAVVGVHGLLSRIKKGDFLVVDGNMGIVLVNPPQEVVADYRRLDEQFRDRREQMEALIPLSAQTRDGTPIRLMANAGNLADIEFALHYQAEGIGLFRTELPFMARESFPSEQEQLELYRKICEKMNGKEVVIRTLDFGGDKLLPEHAKEKNPFLGYRSTRIFLDENDLFEDQLRAILQADTCGRLKLLFPFVSTIGEIQKIKTILQKVKRDLKKEGRPFGDSVPVGVMIEIPSAAILADRILREVDFVSIGTNDLIQYTLAVDRDNDLVSHLYETLNPAVIWLIKHVVDAAIRAGKPVSICGEVAGDSFYTPLLIGLGLREFSVSPMSILDIKKAILGMSLEEAEAVAEISLSLSTAEEIEKCLRARKPQTDP
jgi:phosphotransferase system enzyme I (PtsI)